jgi:predicted extracellular nuclease
MQRYITCFFLLSMIISCANTDKSTTVLPHDLPESWNIAFYNVENLFDVEDDKKTFDEDFTPNGKLQWSEGRLEAKVKNLSKVLQAMGEDYEPPLIIGLAEVENEEVVELLGRTVRPATYGIVHKDSPDGRGIDVALLYDKRYFKVGKKAFYSIEFEEKNYSSRDILYAELISTDDRKESLHCFVNHWPSRRGGWQETETRRMQAANTLKAQVDKLLNSDPQAQVVIMGDFNDYPDNRSLTTALGAVTHDGPEEGELINLAFDLHATGKGTYNYQGEWGMLDQVIISDALLSPDGIQIKEGDLDAFQEDFMMFYDKKSKEYYPNKTYGGDRYYGGFSDHLPLRLHVSTNPRP